MHAESRYFKDVLEGVQTFISWENKELSAKQIDVMLESSYLKYVHKMWRGKESHLSNALLPSIENKGLGYNGYSSTF